MDNVYICTPKEKEDIMFAGLKIYTDFCLDGSPVINARAANYYLAKVATMTKELKEQMDLVINIVDRLEKETNETTN